ncbi:hypothetical protein M9H77_07527 [Catharanthus roseus]|uniref:Uncharacterized protein n=1 Tax=Catharanthus roseus TaxID=4058 RepID=A0ACC0BVF4_CATRO|nr:hypothetical protein M9H77_07527 [Catharanthus roseus]
MGETCPICSPIWKGHGDTKPSRNWRRLDRRSWCIMTHPKTNEVGVNVWNSKEEEDKPSYVSINSVLKCFCGKPSVVRTSWTKDNPGRQFSGCERYEVGGGCGFFTWFNPPMCVRSSGLILGLLRKIDDMEEEMDKMAQLVCCSLIVAGLLLLIRIWIGRL